MSTEKADTSHVQQVVDRLVSEAREAAAVFTQYDQQEVDRIVEAAAKKTDRSHVVL